MRNIHFCAISCFFGVFIADVLLPVQGFFFYKNPDRGEGGVLSPWGPPLEAVYSMLFLFFYTIFGLFLLVLYSLASPGDIDIESDFLPFL